MGTRALITIVGGETTYRVLTPYDGDPTEILARLNRAHHKSAAEYRPGDFTAAFCFACYESALKDLTDTFGPEGPRYLHGNVAELVEADTHEQVSRLNVAYQYSIRMDADGQLQFMAFDVANAELLYGGPLDQCPNTYAQGGE